MLLMKILNKMLLIPLQISCRYILLLIDLIVFKVKLFWGDCVILSFIIIIIFSVGLANFLFF